MMVGVFSEPEPEGILIAFAEVSQEVTQEGMVKAPESLTKGVVQEGKRRCLWEEAMRRACMEVEPGMMSPRCTRRS